MAIPMLPEAFMEKQVLLPMELLGSELQKISEKDTKKIISRNSGFFLLIFALF